MAGRYDKFIKSDKLRERYQALLKDGELTDQKDDLALLRTFCEAIIEKHTAVMSAEDDIDENRISAMAASIERVTRLVSVITQREQAQEFLIHVEDVTKVITKIAEIITRNVPDPALRDSIIIEMTGIQIRKASQSPENQFRLPPAALDVPPPPIDTALSAPDGE